MVTLPWQEFAKLADLCVPPPSPENRNAKLGMFIHGYHSPCRPRSPNDSDPGKYKDWADMMRDLISGILISPKNDDSVYDLVRPLLCGIRRGELVNLRWSAVDLSRRILHIVNVPEAGEFTKSRKNRSLPMHPAVHVVLSQLWAEMPKRIEGGLVVPARRYVFSWPNGVQWKPDWVSREFATSVANAE